MKKLFYVITLAGLLVISLASCKLDTDKEKGAIEVIDFTTTKEAYNEGDSIDFVVNVKNNECYEIKSIQIDDKVLPVNTNERNTRIECFNSGITFYKDQRYELEAIKYEIDDTEEILELENVYVDVKSYKEEENSLKLNSFSLEGLNQNNVFEFNKGKNLTLKYSISYDSKKNIGDNEYTITRAEVMVKEKDTDNKVIASLAFKDNNKIYSNKLNVEGSLVVDTNGDIVRLLKKYGEYELSVLSFEYNVGAVSSRSISENDTKLTFKTSGPNLNSGNITLVNVDNEMHKNYTDELIITKGSKIKAKLNFQNNAQPDELRSIKLKDEKGNVFEGKNILNENNSGTQISTFEFEYTISGSKKENVKFYVSEVTTKNGVVLKFSEKEIILKNSFAYYPLVIKKTSDINSQMLSKDSIFLNDIVLNSKNDVLFNNKVLNANIDFCGHKLTINFTPTVAMFSEITQNKAIKNLEIETTKQIGNAIVANINKGTINNLKIDANNLKASDEGYVVKDNYGTISNVELKLNVTYNENNSDVVIITNKNSGTIKNVVVNKFKMIFSEDVALYIDTKDNENGTTKNMVYVDIDFMFQSNDSLKTERKYNDKSTYYFVFDQDKQVPSSNYQLLCMRITSLFSEDQMYSTKRAEFSENNDIAFTNKLKRIGFLKDNKTLFWNFSNDCLEIDFT